MRYSEEDVANALFAYTDEGISLSKAAQMYGIPKSTLSTRLNGRGCRADQTQPSQRLSDYQEGQLVQWILRQEKLGHPPTHSHVKACIQALLHQIGDTRPLGKNYLTKFI
jgi:hypothetical protein